MVDDAKVLIAASGMKRKRKEEAARLAVKLSKIVEIAKDLNINTELQY